MTRTIVFSLSLLLSNSAVLVQPSGAAAFADKGGSHDIAEIQGCLQREQGFYILVDKNNEYQRLSDNKSFKNLLGHEVKLTGTPEIRTIDTTPPGGASSVIEQHYFRVKTVQDVMSNCHAYGK